MIKVVRYVFWLAYIGFPVVSGIGRNLVDEASSGTILWILLVTFVYAALGCTFSMSASAFEVLLRPEVFQRSISPSYTLDSGDSIGVDGVVADFDTGIRRVISQSIVFSTIIWIGYIAFLFGGD